MSQGPYHLFSLGLLLIAAYLLGLMGVRYRIIGRSRHRKLWNFLLLFFFLSTALLGILLAIRVNYKLDLPWLDQALQWHVDMGIGLTIVSLFHIIWHFRYFLRLGKATPPAGQADLHQESKHLSLNNLQIKRLFVLMGMVSMIAQLVLLRTFVKTFHGNELYIGVYLALWMILTAAGARTGAQYPGAIRPGSLWRTILFLGGIPLVIYLLQIGVTRFIFLPGFLPGLLASVTDILLLLSLFTLTSGFLFGYIARSLREKTSFSGERSGSRGDRPGDESFYRYDSMGALAGGGLFSLFLIFFLDNIQVLGLLFAGTSAAMAWFFRYPAGRWKRLLLLTGASLTAVLLLLPGVPEEIEGWSYRHREVAATEDTPFGNLTFTMQAGQVTGYMDRNPILSSFDPARSEESVHYPALQHPDPDRFLLLGGGLGEVAAEVLKYRPSRVDYCEMDPRLIEVGSRFLPSAHLEKMNVIETGGRKWLRENDTVSYDVIISMAGNPVTLGWNRYFSLEFFRLVRERLSGGGIFCMQLTTSGNYINEPGMEELSVNYRTLQRVFRHILVVPGNSTYFLASDSSLSLDFIDLLEQHPIPTTYVHPDYLDIASLRFDHDQLMDRLKNPEVTINRDLRPTLFLASLTTLQSRWGTYTLPAVGILGSLVFLFLLFTYRPLTSGMYIAGFTGAGIQILIIFVYQSRFGVAYLAAPLLITLFMGGIVAGTLLWKRIWHTPGPSSLAIMSGMMGLTALLTAWLLPREELFRTGWIGQSLLILLNVLPGLMVGIIYSISLSIIRLRSVSKGSVSSYIGTLFSADLAGAALGTLIPSLFIMPLIGIPNTFILLAGMNMAAGLYLWTRQ